VGGGAVRDLQLAYFHAEAIYTRPWGEHTEGNCLPPGNIALAILGAIPGLDRDRDPAPGAPDPSRELFLERIERGSITMGGLDADTAEPTRRTSRSSWAFAPRWRPYLPGADTEAFKGGTVVPGLMVRSARRACR
jgi:hypothetical protein